jgi:hypothetical protein
MPALSPLAGSGIRVHLRAAHCIPRRASGHRSIHDSGSLAASTEPRPAVKFISENLDQRISMRARHALISAEPGDWRSDVQLHPQARLRCASRRVGRLRRLRLSVGAASPGSISMIDRFFSRPASLARRPALRSGCMHARLISDFTGSQSGCLGLPLAAPLSEAATALSGSSARVGRNWELGEVATELAHGLCVNGDCASS